MKHVSNNAHFIAVLMPLLLALTSPFYIHHFSDGQIHALVWGTIFFVVGMIAIKVAHTMGNL